MRSASPLVMFAALAILTSRPAFAISEMTQLKADNIADQTMFAFHIATKKVGENVQFEVTISPKEAALSTILEGHLTVMDEDKTIVSVAVEKTKTDKGVVYRFEVAAKYLPKSEFMFGNMAVSNGVPMAGGDFFWFNLGDFKPRK